MFLKKVAATGMVLSAVALATTETFAAGFQLTEQSVVTLGRAYAGSGITGDDVSAPFYNPAAMVFLPGTQIQLGVTGVSMNQVVKIERGADAGTTNDGQHKTEFLPNFYVTHQINPEWWVGLGITLPFGLSTDYGQYPNWKYGNRGTEAELMDIDINPSFAWKPNDFFSVGGGISLQYAKAKLGLDATLGNLYLGHGEETGDSWGWGWNLGFVLRPTDNFRFGISYRSAIKHKASGHFEISDASSINLGGDSSVPISGLNGKYPSKVTIKTPDTVYASAQWDASNDLTLTGTVRWATWSNSKVWTLRQSGNFSTGNSQVDSNPIVGQVLNGLKNIPIRHHYRDTWLFALGADYKINEQWTVRGGIAYEENAAGKDQTYRVATIPDGDRLFLSLGCSYNFDKHWSVDSAVLWVQGLGTTEFYAHDRTDYQNAGVTNPQRTGKWTTQHSLIYGLQLRYKF